MSVIFIFQIRDQIKEKFNYRFQIIASKRRLSENQLQFKHDWNVNEVQLKTENKVFWGMCACSILSVVHCLNRNYLEISLEK